MPFTSEAAAHTPSPSAAMTVKKSTKVATNTLKFGPLSKSVAREFGAQGPDLADNPTSMYPR
jgi:hypothetical protein